MGAITCWIQADLRHPVVDQPRVLARRDRLFRVYPAREQLTSARAVIAAALGAALLSMLRQPRPVRGDLASLAIVALGVVVGFPLLTALALQYITSAHSIVFIGLLPLATAFFGVLRGKERPKPAFWLFSGVGSSPSPATS
jgi:drug/metabolite transporter (DMT)-like permease